MEYSKEELALYFITTELFLAEKTKEINHTLDVIRFFKNKLLKKNGKKKDNGKIQDKR